MPPEIVVVIEFLLPILTFEFHLQILEDISILTAGIYFVRLILENLLLLLGLEGGVGGGQFLQVVKTSVVFLIHFECMQNGSIAHSHTVTVRGDL